MTVSEERHQQITESEKKIAITSLFGCVSFIDHHKRIIISIHNKCIV